MKILNIKIIDTIKPNPKDSRIVKGTIVNPIPHKIVSVELEDKTILQVDYIENESKKELINRLTVMNNSIITKKINGVSIGDII
tara:strand:+ start:1225 stop:1476 length:252 start_codon:yes stop_codon:yes gene_type:complete